MSYLVIFFFKKKLSIIYIPSSPAEYMQIGVQTWQKHTELSPDLYVDERFLAHNKIIFLADREANSTGFDHTEYMEYSDPTAPKGKKENDTSNIDGNNARRNHLSILFHLLLGSRER